MSRVVIIGGGITGLAAAWELQQQGIDYLLLESSGRLGGKIMTERADGFIIEAAADSFITQKSDGWRLCHEIGLAARLLPTNDDRRQTFVLRGGKLHPMPAGMRLLVPTDRAAIEGSDLLSEDGKRQLLAESAVPPRSITGDESLASFVRRRFGEEVLEVLGEPLLAGIYTGDPARLSMEASFPNYLKLEQSYGSLTAGTLQAPAAAPDPLAPSSVFVSLKSGMAELIEGLQTVLAGEIRFHQTVTAIEPDGRVRLATGESLRAEAVILTSPAPVTARLLTGLVSPLSRELGAMRLSSTGTVSLGYKTDDLPQPLTGFGFVVASREPTHLRACTFNSTKLAGRAPDGYSLLRVFLGGHRAPHDLTLPDPDLVSLARAELRNIMGIKAEPVISRVYRWQNANHQYEVGHVARVAHFQSLCPPWLRLAGSPYGGVGIPDCIRQGRTAARQLSTATV